VSERNRGHITRFEVAESVGAQVYRASSGDAKIVLEDIDDFANGAVEGSVGTVLPDMHFDDVIDSTVSTRSARSVSLDINSHYTTVATV